MEGWACEVPSLQPMGDLGDLAHPRLQSEVKSSIVLVLLALHLNIVLDVYRRRVLLGPSFGPNKTRRL